MAYEIMQIRPDNRRMLSKVDALLAQEGIRRDQSLEYICAMVDEDYQVIATGSFFHDTLRCFAVDHRHQGEGLLNQIVSHLCEVEAQQGRLHLFLYTKPQAAKFFGDLGFCEIARVPQKLVFMENRRDGFEHYLKTLEKTRQQGRSAAVVMNANPFTLGHQYLAETASRACDTLHLFVVSEDASLVPAGVRKALVQAGTAHLPNVQLHDCGPYIISSATFPSYFLRDSAEVIESQARLDLAVFARIAGVLGIEERFVGEEPASMVTGIYNRVMQEELPKFGIQCRILPRLEAQGRPISASTVRTLLQQGDFDAVADLVPPSTLSYFMSSEAEPVLEALRRAGDVVHY